MTVKEMVEYVFAFSVATRNLSSINKLKTRYYGTDVLEISGILGIEELSLIEPMLFGSQAAG